MDLSHLPPQIISWVSNLAWFLIVSFGFSLLARFFWAFDLFSHFTIQYIVGGFALGILLLLMHQYWLAGLCMLVMISSVIETRWLMKDPLMFTRPTAETNFTVMQYNRFYKNNRHDRLENFLSDQNQDIDVVLVQESKAPDIEELKLLKTLYPYQSPESPQERKTDISVLSKYPYKLEYVPFRGARFENFVTRVEIQKPRLSKPVVIYSYHTKVPIGSKPNQRRNEELAFRASAVAKDKSDYVIASGDWNITPYSPYFGDFLKSSGLHYQNYRLLPETSWPAHLLIPFLKIPIDHVLYNDKLTLTDIRRGPAMGSDHHSLIASFAVPDKGPHKE